MRSTWPGIVLLLGAFTGLCTLFAAAATAFDAWREHVQAGWPETTAQVRLCETREYHGTGRGKSYYIRCHLAYTVAGQAVEGQVDSMMVPDPERVIARSPGYPGLDDLEAWVEAHPAGTPMPVHYDPDKPQSMALVVTDMPLAGPKAQGDLRLMGGFAALSAVLLLIGSVGRRRQSP